MDQDNVRRLAAVAVAAPITQALSDTGSAKKHVLIVDDGSALTQALLPALHAAGMYTLVFQFEHLRRPLPVPVISVNWEDVSSIEQGIARVRQVEGGCRGVFFLQTAGSSFDERWLGEALARLRAAIAIARGVSLTNSEPLEFVHFVTAQGGRFGLDSQAHIDALAPGLEALAHPLRMEMPKTSFRSIDLDPATSTTEQAQQLLGELGEADEPFRTAYGWKGGERATLSVQETAAGKADPILDAGSVVVFAGGARGIGAVCARQLAARHRCTVVLLGRTPLDAEAIELSRLNGAARQVRGDVFMREYKASHPGCPPRAPREAWRKKLQAAETVDTLESIRDLGTGTEYYAVDVRAREAVSAVFTAIKQRWGRLDVVVHVAGLGGVETDRMLMRKEWPIIDQVIETKVTGAIHVLEAAEEVGARLFVGFGSIASRFGNSGQVDYASANGLLTGIVRAHNRRGVLPEARVIAWGAWDGVGMAVGGPTKDMLIAHGVRFIAPEMGAECFLAELTGVGPAAPAELYISPSWTGLNELLARQDTVLSLGDEPVALMGSVVERRDGEYLRSERQLDPRSIPFLDHHRYDGTAWVPAVMGMEVAVQAAASLFPELTPFALRDVALKKAVRLVRDEPVLLIAEARFEQRSGEETLVQVTVSARYKERTWVFAEMRVVLGTGQFTQGLADSRRYHSPLPIEREPGKLIRQNRAELYPSDWLRFQISGPTFQVIEHMALNCEVGRTEGRMVSTADLSGCNTPMTFIDGVFQAYGVTLCTILQAWAGPPLYIGEIRWLPGAAQVRETTFAIRTDLQDKENFPVIHVFDPEGQCILRLQRAEQGGTSIKELTEQVRKAGTAVEQDRSIITTPYLGAVIEQTAGHFLRAEVSLDPKTEILLRDHQFHIFVVVPAVYFMEVAVEAAALLLPHTPPCELRDFRVHQMLHLLKDPQTLVTEAQVIAPNQTRIRMLSRRGVETKLHAEGIVVHGQAPALKRLPAQVLGDVQVRDTGSLYPHRFPNGPVFQVIEQMELARNFRSRSQLCLTGAPRPGCMLPVTLLDGAFQVDSATRSGFDQPSGLPKTFTSLRWMPGVTGRERVVCLSSTGDSTTDSPGELFFVDGEQILLHMTGITLTPVLPSVGTRSRT